MKKTFLFIFSSLLFLPFLAFGAGNALDDITVLLGKVQTILFSAAFLIFFWGLVSYIWHTQSEDTDEKAKAKAKNVMVWGIVALFIMFSIYGIISLLQSTLLTDSKPGTQGTLVVPTLPK